MVGMFLRVALAASLAGGSMLLEAQFGPGSPIPGLPGHRRKSQGQDDKNSNKQIISADGLVRSINDKQMEVAVDDGRILTLRLTSETKFTRTGNSIQQNALVPQSTVHVEAEVDSEGFLTAKTVDLVKGASSAAPAPAQDGDAATERTTDVPRATERDTPIEAPNRPILRHGIPTHRESRPSDDDESVHVTKSQPKSQSSPDIIIENSVAAPATATSSQPDLIARTKDWADSFSTSLPNYTCEQLTTRYQQQSKQEGWQPLDVISAHVVYDNGKEEYRDISVGGKKTNKSMLELGGSVSTGEFESTLRSIFSSGSRADFKFYRTMAWHGSDAVIYDFKVALRNSNWQIRVGGQNLIPAYSGSVWLDKTTAQVRRIEMQADRVPQDFPLDHVEWAVDYDMVRLGQSSFLLPIHAENLSCERGSSVCMKNAIDFRNYHKFTGESTITFGK